MGEEIAAALPGLGGDHWDFFQTFQDKENG